MRVLSACHRICTLMSSFGFIWMVYIWLSTIRNVLKISWNVCLLSACVPVNILIIQTCTLVLHYTLVLNEYHVTKPVVQTSSACVQSCSGDQWLWDVLQWFNWSRWVISEVCVCVCFSKRALCVRSTAWTTSCRGSTSVQWSCPPSRSSWTRRSACAWLKEASRPRSTGPFCRCSTHASVHRTRSLLHVITVVILCVLHSLATVGKHGWQRLLLHSGEAQ